MGKLSLSNVNNLQRMTKLNKQVHGISVQHNIISTL